MSTSTATTDREIPRGYWEDANGNLVPVSKIKDIDKERHHLVVRLAGLAANASAGMAQLKADILDEIATYLERSAAEYGVQMRGAAGKGNVTLVSFDGRYKIQRAVQDTIAFDERLQVAKSIIDECVHTWAKGANKNIQALVNHAFQVDKAGQVSTTRVLSLRQLKIDDPKWDQAMQAIQDSMRAISSKSYVRFYERDANGNYQAIPLDLAAL